MLIISGIVLLNSCEEVIDLNLKNSQPQLVIEAVISDELQPFKVKLLNSNGFYDSNNYKTIDNAEIVLSISGSYADTLNSIGNGIYQGLEIKGIEGNEYILTINLEGKSYSAHTIFPTKISLDSINYEWTENPRSSGYMINMFFTDMPNIKNYYRVKVWVNNIFGTNQVFGPDYMLYEDKIFDGRDTKLPAIRGGQLLQLNDTVTVELFSLNKQTFEYYNTLRNVVVTDNSGRGSAASMFNSSSAPANPTTNFDNGALGYFGAYCVSKKKIVIKPE